MSRRLIPREERRGGRLPSAHVIIINSTNSAGIPYIHARIPLRAYRANFIKVLRVAIRARVSRNYNICRFLIILAQRPRRARVIHTGITMTRSLTDKSARGKGGGKKGGGTYAILFVSRAQEARARGYSFEAAPVKITLPSARYCRGVSLPISPVNPNINCC